MIFEFIKEFFNEDILKWGLGFGAFFWAIFSMVEKMMSFLKWEINFHLCEVCLTFWMTFILTFNPFIAGIAAMLKWFVEKNDDIKL
jgi:hypothetical protein